MSIQARLEGGPWDGECVELDYEVSFLVMGPSDQDPPASDGVNEYRIKRREPTGELVFTPA